MAAAAASVLACAACAATKVVLFFDTEDYTCDRSNDAIRDIANILKSEGVKGNFNVVGFLATRIVELKRYDVIESLRHHVLGTQTLYHSRHPNIAEMGDNPNYWQAYRDTMADEAKCVGMLEAAFGEGRVVFACPPGNSVSLTAFDVYSDLGIRVNAGTGFVGGDPTRGPYREGMLVRKGTEVGGLWYFNQYHFPYYRGFTLESFLPRPGKACPDFGKWCDDIAKYDIVGLYMHPHIAVKTRHGDGVNYRYGNLCEWRKWKQVEDRDPADTAVYYERMKKFIQTIKADPRLEFTDIEQLIATFKPRRSITRSDIPAIRAALLKDFNAIREPASWSVADVFQAATRMLRGENEHTPGKAFGFLQRPRGVASETVVSAEDLASAAKSLDLSTFLPPELPVRKAKIGPADFLFAALEAIETGADEVKVAPRDQLGDIASYLPKLATVNFKGTWIYTPEYEDRWTSNRLRWQFWTFRYERPSDWPERAIPK